MTLRPRHIFVYGTLRKDPQHEMYHVLARVSRFVGEGVVRAQLYDLGAYPGIVVTGSPGAKVRGELYELAADQRGAMLKRLDAYEGVDATDPQPHEFRRQLVDVFRDGDLVVPAWTYVLTSRETNPPRIEADDYLMWKRTRGRAGGK